MMDIMNTNGNVNSVSQRYLRLYGGVIYDVLEHFGYPNQVLSPDFSPLAPEMMLAGYAFTVKGTTTSERNQATRYTRLKMIEKMEHPCIEVRDAGTPYPVALYGELSATASASHGAVGALIDGGARDCSKLIAMGFPVFARYRSPIEAFGRWSMLDFQVPIQLSGSLVSSVEVNPGDFIFGDLDGVLVIPGHLTIEVLSEAERVSGIEDDARKDFARGEDPVKVFERHKRL